VLKNALKKEREEQEDTNNGNFTLIYPIAHEKREFDKFIESAREMFREKMNGRIRLRGASFSPLPSALNSFSYPKVGLSKLRRHHHSKASLNASLQDRLPPLVMQPLAVKTSMERLNDIRAHFAPRIDNSREIKY
jgi:hypothetical protein